MFTVIIPAYNEARRIQPTLEQLTKELDSRKLDYQILVVEESSDETPQIVQRFGQKNPRVRNAHFTTRLGKGGGLVEGLKLAAGDAITYDADAATPASEIPKLLSALQQNDLAIGSRYLPGSHTVGVTGFRKIASRLFNLLVRLLFFLPFVDTQCGFKAVKASAIPKLLAKPFHSRGFEWDIELLARAKQLGLRVAEVPVEWHHVEGGTVEGGSTLKTGWKMFKGLLKLRAAL